MARIEIPEDEGMEVMAALQLAPHFAEVAMKYEEAVAASPLDRRLHELVRMRIAYINECAVCRNWRNEAWGVSEEDYAAVPDFAGSPLFSDTEKVALEYAERFAVHSAGIDDDLLERLGKHFEPAQIVDLTLVLGKYLAMGKFMQVLGLDQSCSITAHANGDMTVTQV
ncbi:carboxymuconolactone decarboxylase family protein [Yinghuangia soli]|uniref:Carboxymuconolactone decarboxylase family protein n=1 Tax=Yinghuangia soli TaxID=2908204 RepID=A0AA41Q677_9ACTN|nr:carboxymuconolactone decarboxylase family protein [Yinghuangia soli]MCF2530922.1 carboxymuconolactone decarboxylase family protein [Yinghuangia soli]